MTNRNTKDFADPTIGEELAAGNCELVGSFDNGLQYVLSQLQTE